MSGIRSPNLPLGMSLGEFIGNEIAGNTRSLKRFSRESVLGPLEPVVAGAQVGGGVGFATKSDADAHLVFNQFQLALVTSDPDPAKNGVYQKTGASGSGNWLRIADLPNEIIRLTVTGGTADAIVATMSPQIPTSPDNKLYVLVPTANNTGAVTINGVVVKNNLDATLAADTLISSSPVVMLWKGDHYQLLLSLPVDATGVLTDTLAARDATIASATAAAGSATAAAASAAAAASVIGLFIPPQGRLTLTSGVPDMLTSVAGAASVYYGLAGQIVPIFDGTNMVPVPLTAILQCLLSDNTKSPAAAAANSAYDFFVWLDSGTIRLTRGPAWSNFTTRGYSLTQIKGVSLNASNITNGPAAQRGTWVASGFTDAASATISFVFGGMASGGVAGNFGIWNLYNRVQVATKVIDNGASYTNSSSTWRQARASAGMQVKFMTGLQEDVVQGRYRDAILNAANNAAQPQLSLGFNTITVPSTEVDFGFGNGTFKNLLATGQWLAPVGVNVLSANQQGDLTNTYANTFNVNGTSNTFGLDFTYWY